MNLADLPERQLKIEPFRLRLHNGIFVRQDPSEKKKMPLDCIETGLRLARKSGRGAGTWLTGEAKMLGEDQIYFQFGKSSPDNVGYYDDDGKAFLKKPAKKAGHTLICVDVNLQLVGIVPNSKIARKTVAIAKIQETKNAGLKTIKRDTWNFMRWRGMPRFRLPAFLLACLSPAHRLLSLNCNPTAFAFWPECRWRCAGESSIFVCPWRAQCLVWRRERKKGRGLRPLSPAEPRLSPLNRRP